MTGIFQVSENNVNPTRATKFKVAVNMADLNSLIKHRSYP